MVGRTRKIRWTHWSQRAGLLLLAFGLACEGSGTGQPGRIVQQASDPRCVPVGGAYPSGFALRPGSKATGAVMQFTPKALLAFNLATSPPTLLNQTASPPFPSDSDGDGRNEIAAVVTPHLGAVLKLYEWQGDRLVEDHRADGFSNHAIGSPEQGLADIADMNGDGLPDLIIPDAARRNLRIVTFSFGTFRQLAEVVNTESIGLAVLAQDLDGDGRPEAVMAPGGRLKVVKFLP